MKKWLLSTAILLACTIQADPTSDFEHCTSRCQEGFDRVRKAYQEEKADALHQEAVYIHEILESLGLPAKDFTPDLRFTSKEFFNACIQHKSRSECSKLLCEFYAASVAYTIEQNVPGDSIPANLRAKITRCWHTQNKVAQKKLTEALN